MPLDVSADSFAAGVITTLFWWTVLSPPALLAILVLGASRPRLRAALTLVVLLPPLLVLLPVAVMKTGVAALASAVAAALFGAGIVLAVTALALGRRRPGRGARYSTAAITVGIAGGMLGSGALVWALTM